LGAPDSNGRDQNDIPRFGCVELLTLDNDIAPAAQAGLFTVRARRGPWGSIRRPARAAGTG